MSTTVRMMQLLSLLQTHRYWTGAELAQRLQVSPRTVRRDVDRLRDLGYPVDADRGVGGGYQLRAGAVLPPLVLDDEEAVAIAVGLATAAGGSVAGMAESSVRALSKIIQVMPSRLRSRITALQAATVPSVLSGPTVDAAVLTSMAHACRDHERIRFAYTARDGQATERQVEPHRLVSWGRRWYLVAYDVTRHDWRTFRVDRATGLIPSGARFLPRELPLGDAAAFVQASIASTPTTYEVEVTIQVPAEVVQRMVARWGTVETVDAGSCRLVMGVDSLDWPTFVLGAVDAPFQVLRPPELVEHLRETGRRFLQAEAGAIG